MTTGDKCENVGMENDAPGKEGGQGSSLECCAWMFLKGKGQSNAFNSDPGNERDSQARLSSSEVMRRSLERSKLASEPSCDNKEQGAESQISKQ